MRNRFGFLFALLLAGCDSDGIAKTSPFFSAELVNSSGGAKVLSASSLFFFRATSKPEFHPRVNGDGMGFELVTQSHPNTDEHALVLVLQEQPSFRGDVWFRDGDDVSYYRLAPGRVVITRRRADLIEGWFESKAVQTAGEAIGREVDITGRFRSPDVNHRPRIAP